MGSSTSRAAKHRRRDPWRSLLTELGHERALAIAEAAAISDPSERVHRQRVAIRRLRSLIRLSKPLLSAEPLERVDRDLAWLASKLGDCRDVDVLTQLVRVDVERFQADPANALLETVEIELDRRRASADDELLRALASARFRRLKCSLETLDLGEWVTVDGSVEDLLPSLVERQWKRLNRARDQWRSVDDYDGWHRMRMRAKNLRFSLDAFIPCYPQLKHCAGELGDLTDLMGACCDAHNERELLAAVARGSDVAVAFDAGRLAVYSELAQTSVRDKLPAQWVRVHRSWKAVGW
jgi:CHAD domain-containing protein